MRQVLLSSFLILASCGYKTYTIEDFTSGKNNIITSDSPTIGKKGNAYYSSYQLNNQFGSSSKTIEVLYFYEDKKFEVYIFEEERIITSPLSFDQDIKAVFRTIKNNKRYVDQDKYYHKILGVFEKESNTIITLSGNYALGYTLEEYGISASDTLKLKKKNIKVLNGMYKSERLQRFWNQPDKIFYPIP